MFKSHVLTVLGCVFLAGCGIWRPLPSHGGGKRLDEEQRIIAGAIRTAIQQIDVQELAGKDVILEITAMSHDGGGQASNPGISQISAAWSEADTTYVAGTTPFRDNTREGWDARMTLSMKPNLRPTVFRSQSDMDYFTASLLMKLRLSDVTVVGKGGQVTLHVIVDILGTNLSTEDLIILWSENLKATCEFTYFAVEGNDLLFEPRSVGASATYKEKSSLFYLFNGNEFSMKKTPITGFPNYGNQEIMVDSHDHQDIEISQGEDVSAKKQNNLKAMLELAESYISARQFDAAQSIINDVLKIDPEYPGLGAVMSRLQNERSSGIRRNETPLDILNEN